MKINARETLGFTLIVAALILVPVAWATSRMLWFAAFLLLVLGSVLFWSERMARRLEASEAEPGGTGSGGQCRAMPTDIHNYTGWRSGGRSETMDSPTSSDDD